MTWILLTFHDNYADEFDVESAIVTTKDRWEKAKLALKVAYPDGQSFDAYFGTNENNCYDAQSYIDCFKEHEISLGVARVLAKILGRSKVKLEWQNKKCTLVSWFYLIEHGVLPAVPDANGLEDWNILLSFPIPPQRCAAHDNIIGQCNEGRGEKTPWASPCRVDDIPRAPGLDPDSQALLLDKL